MTDSTTSKSTYEAIDLASLPNEITNRTREIWLAGLGALSRLEEEGDKVFGELVERGEAYEAKRRHQFNDMTNSLIDQQTSVAKDVANRFDAATKTMEQAVSSTLSGTLGRIGVPTRSEVQSLSNKVSDLSTKLDALSALLETQEGAAVETTVLHVTPYEEGWAVIVDGADEPLETFDVKKDALSAGRDAAREHAPSELIIHKQDGEVQDTVSYEADAA
jgi:poly(hydroxyalkanoate) granule-associated protein